MRRVVSARLSAAMGIAFVAGLTGCTGARALVADDGDLADYRAYRVAELEGERLARAQIYLDAHPRGAWAREVGHAFEDEEPRFFERAQASRAGVRSYLGWLPRGPHAAAAQSLLQAFDTHLEDDETAHLVQAARHTEAMLAAADEQRRAVGEAVLAAVSALLDPAVYGARIEDAPPALTRVLGGRARATWAGAPSSRDEDLYYLVPTTLERESRVVTLHVEVLTEDGRVVEGRVEGVGLFVAWAEADEHRPLDPTTPADRATAAQHAVELLGGAFEATLPNDRCRARGTGVELFVRRCDGWTVAATMGEGPRDPDGIRIRGPVVSAP